MKSRQKPGVVFQPQVSRSLQRGIQKVVNAVRPTLGPAAGRVAIDNLNKVNKLPEFLSDGGTIARRIIELPDRDEDMGAMLIRAMITRQHERVGDGTATAAVLFDAIFSAGLRFIAAGGNAMLLRTSLEAALPLILKELDRMAFRLAGQADLTSMARSLCHDDALAELLGEAFDVLGEYGRLEVREDYGRILRREYVEGSFFHPGLFSRSLAPENSAGTLTLEDASVFLCDFEVENHTDLFPVLQAANESGVKSLLIVARNLSEKAISLLVANNNLGKFRVAAVQLPGHNNPDERMDALKDLGLLTGATPFMVATGMSLETFTPKHFGTVRRVWTDPKSFNIVNGGGDPRLIRKHLQDLKKLYHNTKDATTRQKVGTRIGNLLGGAITLHVGGFSESEINSRKAIAERAALAMRAAIEEGVVPGGGVALLRSRAALSQMACTPDDAEQYAAIRILNEALEAPARTIFQNGGFDPSEIIARLSFEGPEMGFDVLADRIVNVREAGILDGVHVLKASVTNAVSTAALALTIETMVHIAKPEMVSDPQ